MRLNKLDLNLLVVLDTLFNTLSVTQAAERLNLSQPATSLALGRLREYFNDPLLQQVGKKFVLTPLALQLVNPVRDVLLQIHAISRANPTFDPSTSTRRFVIEASDYIIAVLVGELVRKTAEIAPHIQFDLRAISPETPEHLDSGEVDLLIVAEFSMVKSQPYETLFHETYSCLACSEHFKGVESLTTEEYFQQAHVSVEWGGGRRVTYDTRIITNSQNYRRQEIIAPTFSLLPELIVGTHRITTLPTRLAKKMASNYPLTLLPCPLSIPPFDETVQWNKYRGEDLGIRWLRSLLADISKVD